jgi:hypothetical protein
MRAQLFYTLKAGLELVAISYFVWNDTYICMRRKFADRILDNGHLLPCVIGTFAGVTLVLPNIRHLFF